MKNYKNSLVYLLLLLTLALNTAYAQGFDSARSQRLKFDIEHFTNHAAKLTRLCEGALKENSYLDRLSKPENLTNATALRPVLRFWKLFLRFSATINKVAEKYEVSLLKQHSAINSANFEPYTLGITARLTHIVMVSQLMNFLESRPKLHLLLNEANTEFEIGENLLKKEVGKAISAAHLARLYRFRLSHYDRMKSENKLPEILVDMIQAHKEVLDHLLKAVAGKPAWKMLGRTILDSSLDFILPAQKAIFTWVGDSRIRKQKTRLVSKAMLKKFHAMLKPGDIILERQDWYLSNLFLPGFWPHGIIYLGDRKQLSEFFDKDKEVQNWCRKNDCKTFLELLEKDFPKASRAYLKGSRIAAHKNVVIEAISEGVVFNSIEESCHADYLAALRPRLRKIDIAKAIHQAFYYFGREYDFRFSFDSEQTMVCTELVSKAYCRQDERGLKLPYTLQMGKYGVTSDSIVETFALEHKTPQAQMDFVAFAMGLPSKNKAVFADVETFKLSHRWRGGLKSSDTD
ncbi:MAG: hypothetical protein PWR01_4053 [Clostridiales bacterium]|nr:hypothetical protein [Clostridiales bacterium]MDN5282980.1 hypothetical protein [Candidatus Ozemobacter sp.]